MGDSIPTSRPTTVRIGTLPDGYRMWIVEAPQMRRGEPPFCEQHKASGEVELLALGIRHNAFSLGMTHPRGGRVLLDRANFITDPNPVAVHARPPLPFVKLYVASGTDIEINGTTSPVTMSGSLGAIKARAASQILMRVAGAGAIEVENCASAMIWKDSSRNIKADNIAHLYLRSTSSAPEDRIDIGTCGAGIFQLGNETVEVDSFTEFLSMRTSHSPQVRLGNGHLLTFISEGDGDPNLVIDDNIEAAHLENVQPTQASKVGVLHPLDRTNTKQLAAWRRVLQAAERHCLMGRLLDGAQNKRPSFYMLGDSGLDTIGDQLAF